MKRLNISRLIVASLEAIMVQVRVSEGVLEGETVISEIGGTFHSFKGIPYARPPTGNLRFKAPQPMQPWVGVRSANQFGNQCYQFNFMERLRENGSEDCLYLNVYTPNVKPSKPLPVMVYIHGGGFCAGNGNDDKNGPDFLIRHGVVLVTLNYRLEVLGFLCLDTEDVPGNAGMKDQVAALRWVKRNISNFGGDASSITIFGSSSGSASVFYHCVSPMTKGLFKRAIALSGAIAYWWTYACRPRYRAVALAETLGFTSEDDKELYEFFKKQPVEVLAEIQVPLTLAEKEKDKYDMQFIVVREKVFPNIEPFLTEDCMQALNNSIHDDVEFMIGYNENEGTLKCSTIFDINTTIYQANNFKEYMVPRGLALWCSSDDQLDVGKAFRDHYFQKKPLTADDIEILEKFWSTEFKFGIWQSAKVISKTNKVYFYKFTCNSERNFTAKLSGVLKNFKNKALVSHNDDTAYIFPINSLNNKYGKGSSTLRMINNMTKLLTNFAKSGNPTPDSSLGVFWKQFHVETQSYLEIGNKLAKCYMPDKEELQFWLEVFEEYLPKKVSYF